MLSRLALCSQTSSKLSSAAFRTLPNKHLVKQFSLSRLRDGIPDDVSWTKSLCKRIVGKLDQNASAMVRRLEKFGPALIPVGIGGLAFLKGNAIRPKCKVKDRRIGLDSAEKTPDPPFNWPLFLEFLKPQVYLTYLCYNQYTYDMIT